MSTGYLAVVALVQNEALNLPEWIEHHRMLGADRFLLYDNDSTDDTVAVGVELGAQVIPWPGREGYPQMAAHLHALDWLAGKTVWAAFIDPDEFILADRNDLYGELFLREGEQALGMSWACFGTSNLTMRPESARMSYVRRSAKSEQQNRHIKSIVHIGKAPLRKPLDPHHFLGVRTVGFDGELIEGPFREPDWGPVRLNHYISRSIPEAEAKMAKRRPNTNDFYTWDLRDGFLNEVYDNTMALTIAHEGVLHG